jgi:hypothetical protein
MATILDAMLACWMAVMMDGENPPDTSVPNPTCKVDQMNGLHLKDTKPRLNSAIQPLSYMGNPTAQIEVAGGAMAQPRLPLTN